MKKHQRVTAKDLCKGLNLDWAPLTKDRWLDFEKLFGERGACGGCWCMLWRLSRSEYERSKGEGNRLAMKKIVESGQTPGILGFTGQKPVAWCSVVPRETFPALQRSRILKKVDDQPVWSISCFFIHKDHRGMGVSTCMTAAAVDYVKANGGHLLEAYPVEPKKGRTAPAFAWTGLASAFRKAGYTECARRSETRPIMRCRIT
jgi:GNAT superfamily N-acetyltransferase